MRVFQVRPAPAKQFAAIPSSASAAETGFAEIAWEPNRYRERVSSAGFTTERGIQGGKAYATDEDGYTRVVSEPVLAELQARSYFWRRGWLFQDRERARLSLAPAEAASVSVRLALVAGNRAADMPKEPFERDEAGQAIV